MATTTSRYDNPTDCDESHSRIDRAIEAAVGRPVEEVLQSLAGLSRKEMRQRIGLLIGDTISRSAPDAKVAVSSDGLTLTDPGASFSSPRALPGDHLILDDDSKYRPITSVAPTALGFTHAGRVPSSLRQGPSYRIVRPWLLSDWAIKCLCQRHEIVTRREHFDRARYRGRHQMMIARAYRKPYPQVIDNLLFAEAGVDNGIPLSRPRLDLIDLLRTLPEQIYNHRVASASQRKNLRQTVLRALVNRSMELGLRFHLRADLPGSVMDIPD